MAVVCVLCGKSYARKVTQAHVWLHGIKEKTYAKKANALPEAAWAFYWDEANDPIQNIFPNPLKKRANPFKGFLTYEQWGRDRHPEWW